ncbi:uncharacterized protein LOC121380922 isoform X2 [Gigantopelta aegis]|uniref:uncharacterized protein LOC121380922 isoform X2 n=1 Tax=Gigantopelta aegis TaxID=1735272 RepID=UPI001B88A0C5|nr:uncharacterized protein LOC121380922 isoform X2 [Gigantopelta aegis]
MSAGDKHYNDHANPVPSFPNHNGQTHNQFTQQPSPTFTPNEHATTTTLPPFSSMMQMPFTSTSESTKYQQYDKEIPFTESRNQIPSQSQPSYSPSVDPTSTNLSETHFYRSAIRSSDLPNPLPVPLYSQELLNARECGRTVEYRSMVIRETVKYFLKMKYWWTSEDYDAMAQMVAREFPDLRDSNVTPGQPDYVRIRAHLSQTARNLRRVAKNQQHRKLIGKTETSTAAATTHSGVETEQESVDISSNRMALPSVAHILSKQYLTPSPMSYPMSTASLLPQMMSASSILASPTYQKYLHSSLLAMSPEGMSSLSQKLLSQLATGSYASLPAFGHSPGFPYPVKVEPKSVMNEYGPSSSYVPSRTDAHGDDVQPHHQGRDSVSPESSEGSPRDTSCRDGEDLPIHFGAEHGMTRENTESQRHVSPTAHHVPNFNPARSRNHSSAKDAHKRARSNSECEDGSKSPHTGLSDEAELPNPLPIPKYSERVLSANEMGMTKDMRSTIIRETTTFFLNIKYRWTSSDYDRISSMVVSLFPALRDPISSPGYAPTRRVRSDLSMCARNIRRRDVNKITTGYARKKSRAAMSSFVYDPRVSLSVKAEPVFSQYSDLSHKFWEQKPQIHEIHGQTFENKPMTESAYDLTAREIARQNLMMMANSVNDMQTNSNDHPEDHGSSNLHVEKHSESRVVGEAGDIKTGHNGITNMPAMSVDANIPHGTDFSNREPRNENVVMASGAENLHHDKSHFKQDSYESESISMTHQNKECPVIESEPSNSHVAETLLSFHHQGIVTVLAPGSVSNTGHIRSESSETFISSYTGPSANITINSSSASGAFKSSGGGNSTVGAATDPHHGSRTIDSSPHEPTFRPAPPVGCDEMAVSGDGDVVSSSRLSAYVSESSASSASHCSPLITNSANNQRYDTGQYSSDVDLESGTGTCTPDKQIRHSDPNKSSAGTPIDGQDDSSCALMFTPLIVKDSRTNSNAEGNKVNNEPGMEPRTIGMAPALNPGEQTSSLMDGQSEMREKMAAIEPCDKAADGMERILPHQHGNLGPLGLAARSKIQPSKQYATGNTLPDPLPVPTYSLDICKQQQLGRILEMKNQVVKETVSFYLQWKSIKWRPADYSRVVKMILLQFPEFKAVKMLKNMVFFTVRNLCNRRQFFQAGRYWNKKRLQYRPKITANTNQRSGPKIKTDDSGGENNSSKSSVAASTTVSSVSSGKQFTSQTQQPQEMGTFDQMADSQNDKTTFTASHSSMCGVEITAEPRADYQNSEHGNQPSQSVTPSDTNSCGTIQQAVSQQTGVTFPGAERHISEVNIAGDLSDNVMHPANPASSDTHETQKESSATSSHGSDPNNKNVPDHLRTSLTRQISLPNPLPVPQYSQQLLSSKQDYTLKHHRLQIIRETVKYFLLIKYWWSSRDYERIAEMVITQFPRLADHGSHPSGPTYRKVRRELSMCARNLRRRFVKWDQQSSLNDPPQDPSNMMEDDVKEPNTMNNEDLRTELMPKQEREITPINAAADSGLRSSECPRLYTESASSTGHHVENTGQSVENQQTQAVRDAFQPCGYRSNMGTGLSPLDHHGHLTSAVPIAYNVLKMKKTYVNPDHGNLLQTQLSQLWKEGKYFDADLEVNGTKIPTHKLILLAMCPFLQSTLDQMDTKHRIEISMPENSTIEAVDAFLKYLYDGVIHINTDTVHALSKIADMMHIHRLYKHCQDFIESWKKEQQLQEEELNVYRLSLRVPDGDSGQGLHHGYQAGANFHGARSERYPSTSVTVGDDTARQQYLYHQSGQSFDNVYDKSKVQQIQNSVVGVGNSSTNPGNQRDVHQRIQNNVVGVGNSSTNPGNQRDMHQRDLSLKVDRRVSDQIADSYTRRTSWSGQTDPHPEQTVKQERSESSSCSVVTQNSCSALYKQEVDSGQEQSVFPQWWPTKM